MTFIAATPNAAISPGYFPAQSLANFTQLKNIIQKDHQFNDTSATDDGYHNQLSFKNLTGPTFPVLNAASNGLGGTLSTDLGTGTTRNEYFHRSSDTTATNLLACRAAVLFPGGTLPNEIMTPLFTHNVTEVKRTAEGRYTITFTTLPTAKFCPFLCVQPPAGSTYDIRIAENNVYTDSMTTTTLKVEITNSSSDYRDPVVASVLIFGG